MNPYNQKKQKVNNQINADSVEQKIDNTGKLKQEINAKQVQIGAKRVTCPKCKTANKTSSRFCKKCGQSLTKICNTCWTENELTTVFCTSCGTEVDKSKFGIPLQLAQAWKEKFVSLGWRSQTIDETTSAILERMGQPIDQHEIVLLSTGVSSESYIHKLSVVGKDVLPDPIFKERVTGSLLLTSQRTIVKNRIDGWIASYPHEYLDDLSTNQGSTLINGYKKAESFVFFLNYKNLGRISIHKLLPTLVQPRGVIARITSSDLFNAQMDLQTTMVNSAIVQRLRESHDESTVFVNFFQSIIELQKNYHKNKKDFTSGLSYEQFIYEAPEIKLPPVKDSCAPKAVAMFLLICAVINLAINWLF